jgi:hypothetical protein
MNLPGIFSQRFFNESLFLSVSYALSSTSEELSQSIFSGREKNDLFSRLSKWIGLKMWFYVHSIDSGIGSPHLRLVPRGCIRSIALTTRAGFPNNMAIYLHYYQDDAIGLCASLLQNRWWVSFNFIIISLLGKNKITILTLTWVYIYLPSLLQACTLKYSNKKILE